MRKRKYRLESMPLAFLAEKALKEAVYEAVKDHARTGDPVAVWRRGRVCLIPASRLRLKKPSSRSGK